MAGRTLVVDPEPSPVAGVRVGGSRLARRVAAHRSDEALVAGVRRGEDACFAEVFDRHSPALLSFCRHMLGSREDAEDALQQVFVSAHAAMQRSDGELRLRPWLFTIARNRCLSMLRARRDEVLLDDTATLASGEGLAAEVSRREDLRAMLADIQDLPEDQRAALLLAELGARSHDEIAGVLDVRPAKVKALIFQARESLAASRVAREASCPEIREQLATLRGSALRRGPLRRHVAGCPGCQDFEAEVTRQRAAMAILLPVIPTLGLKSSILSGIGLTGTSVSGVIGGTAGAGLAGAGGAGTVGAAGAGAGGSGMLLGGQAAVAKILAAVVVAGGVGGGGVVAVQQIHSHRAAVRSAPMAPADGRAPGTGPGSTQFAPGLFSGSPARSARPETGKLKGSRAGSSRPAAGAGGTKGPARSKTQVPRTNVPAGKAGRRRETFARTIGKALRRQPLKTQGHKAGALVVPGRRPHVRPAPQPPVHESAHNDAGLRTPRPPFVKRRP